MRTALISDIHLNPQRPAATQMFADFMAAAQTQLGRVYILGDLFDYWVGDDGSETLGYLPVENMLRQARDAGVEIFFMAGNRDFLVGEAFAQRSGCTILPDPCLVNLDGRNFLLSHGDALCTADTEHQAARKQMLSPQWQAEVLKQPLETRIQTAKNLRAVSESNKAKKPLAIMDVTQDAVENLLRQYGVDTLIHGHTHRPAVHEFRLDGKPAWRYVLGDWYTQSSALYLEGGALNLEKLLPPSAATDTPSGRETTG